MPSPKPASNPVRPTNGSSHVQLQGLAESFTPEQVAQLKDRVEVLELRAREFEAQARIAEAKYRVSELQSKIRAQRMQGRDAGLG
jgi:chaperonin cofactor prefoldin